MAEPIIIIKEPGPPPIGGTEDDGHEAELMQKAGGQGNPPPAPGRQRRLQIDFEGDNRPEKPLPLSYESDESLVGSEWVGKWNDETREVRISRVRNKP